MKKAYIIQYITDQRRRSAWDEGVKNYALELLEELPEQIDAFKAWTFDYKQGAESWKQYSYCGCSLIYDEDIARRLCSPSELKRTRHGARRPNRRETWLDVQGRALWQAHNLIITAVRHYIGTDLLG